MAIETGGMTERRVLESCRIRNKGVGPTASRSGRHRGAQAVTNLAVVVVLRLIISARSNERSPYEMMTFINGRASKNPGDDVLVFIVRKLNHKLAGGGRFTKYETCVVPWRYLRVATAANCRLRAFEKLLPMTTHTGSMTGKICSVGKLPYLFPVSGWNFVAGITGSLMLFSGVGESRIVERGFGRASHGWFAHASLLSQSGVVKTNNG